MIKRIFSLLLILVTFFSLSFTVFAKEDQKIFFFYGKGCPHCLTVEKFLEDNQFYKSYPIETKEIYSNHDNAVLYNQLLDELEIPSNQRGVPTMIIGNQVFIGDQPIIDNFVIEADKFLKEDKAAQTPEESKQPDKELSSGLTIAAVIGASIVDAINPCAFAVLIILMTTILASGDSKKALRTGIAFATSIFISYFLMGIGIYKALEVGNLSGIFYKIVGWIALIMGLLNLKDYFWYGKGVLMEVPMSWRPKLKSIIKSTTSPIGAFGIGFIVSLFLLPCTSGPYIVILGMLAQKTTQAKAILYLLLYNLIFVTPMLIISKAVYHGFDPDKAEEIRQKRLKLLHLIAGIIMVVMGMTIVSGVI